MSFINFLNYKKYIGRSTDAQAARIGHVNAVYNDLKPTVGYVAQLTSLNTNVELNTLSGKIELENNIATITGNQFADFKLINNHITPDSIVLLQITGTDVNTSDNPFAFTVVSNIEEGGCRIIAGISENGFSILSPVIHFLIIN